MKSQLHHIQKQQLIMDFSTEEKSINWHKTASTFYYNRVLPLLNTVLDRHFSEDCLFTIDNLEIDLGNLEKENLQESFLKKTEQELTRLLKETPIQNTSANDSELNPRAGEKIFIKENKEHLLECFYFFLDHGTLPWSSSFISLALLEADLKQEIGLKKLTGYREFQNRLRNKDIRRRLYFQFSRSLWNELYKIEQSHLNSIRDELTSILILLAKNNLAKKQIRQELSEDIEDWIGNTASPYTQEWPQQYIHWMIEKASPFIIPRGETAILPFIIQELTLKKNKQLNTKGFTQTINAVIALKDPSQKSIEQQDFNENIFNHNTPKSAKEQNPVLPEIGNKKHSTKYKGKGAGTENPLGETKKPDPGTAQDEQAGNDSKMQQIQHKEIKVKDSKSLERGGSPEDYEDQHSDDTSELSAYYIQHAGVILTWPYLPRLFKHVGYLDGNVFKDMLHKQKAVHLLAYISSGHEQSEEPELIMAKFLCGWPLHMPIIKVLDLSHEEKDEANQLLQNLILNWPVLKSTSIEGLRGSFFSRDGKLFREEENWRLLVELKSYDMLLDHLPYALSIIKLPWMKNILKVDWA